LVALQDIHLEKILDENGCKGFSIDYGQTIEQVMLDKYSFFISQNTHNKYN